MKISSNPRHSKNVLLQETFKLAAQVLTYSDGLILEKRFALANQILRAGTSIGANSREAQNAESTRDFIHKLKIAAKESEELDFWMHLMEYNRHDPTNVEIINQNYKCIKILNSIISKSKNKIK